ncbi:MAG: hypothetical protein PHP50_11380 [Lachnospiraceae bacterium]|nr:hypothetical protein [Lachnospiraceae bacterium]
MLNMRRTKLGIMVLAVCMVIGVICTVSLTVMSREAGQNKIDEAHYLELETDYLKETKCLLKEQGYRNSGVMLTRVIDSNGTRSYKITIHNKMIDYLSESEKNALLQDLKNIVFVDDNCNIQHIFL